MTTGIADNMERLATLKTKAFTEELLHYYYPPLFLLLDHTGHLLQELQEGLDISLLQSAHNRMNREMRALHLKEQHELFPLLLQLEADEVTSESCQPFKNVKQHYTGLLAATQQLKTFLFQLMQDLDRPGELQDITDKVRQFEQALIRIQNAKEQYLFRPFRNCNNSCKTVQP